MKKKDDGDDEREDRHIRLGMKHVKTQIGQGSSINGMNDESQMRVDSPEGQGSGSV